MKDCYVPGSVVEHVRTMDIRNLDGIARGTGCRYLECMIAHVPNEMQTPWFASEYIMDTCRDDLESMAQASAEDAEYAEEGDPRVVTGIA